jgi:hypothetical protein
MITSTRIKDMLNRQPFQPFRIFLSDGSHHDVPHPEFAWVFGGSVYVGIPGKGSSETGDRVKEMAILHITRVEKLTSHKPKSRK